MTQRLQIRADHASSAGVFPPECAAIAPRPENSCQTDRSFYISEEAPTFASPMPIDEYSGIPLPISPRYMEAQAGWPAVPLDIQHTWPENIQDGTISLRDRALHDSRIEVVTVKAHRQLHAASLWPEFPQNDDEYIKPLIFAALSYIPRQAISFNRWGEPIVEDVPYETREKMREEEQIRIGSVYHMQSFLCEYLVQRFPETEFIKDHNAIVDEFLHTKDKEWQLKLGNGFLRVAARHAMQPLQSEYAEAIKNELVYPPRHSQTVTKFVAKLVLHPNYLPVAHLKLRQSLEAA